MKSKQNFSMSKTKITAKQVVERYHERYIQYENAFAKDPFSASDMQNELKVLATSDIDTDSEDFLNKMIKIVIEKPQKSADVNNAALKFAHSVEFYLLIKDKDLPENIKQDYERLPIRATNKAYYSIEGGKFIENEKLEVTDEMRAYFKTSIEQYKKM